MAANFQECITMTRKMSLKESSKLLGRLKTSALRGVSIIGKTVILRTDFATILWKENYCVFKFKDGITFDRKRFKGNSDYNEYIKCFKDLIGGKL